MPANPMSAAGGGSRDQARNDPFALNLNKEAWRQLGELMETGQITLANGRVLDVAKQLYAYIKTVQWIASVKLPKLGKVALPEDFAARETLREVKPRA